MLPADYTALAAPSRPPMTRVENVDADSKVVEADHSMAAASNQRTAKGGYASQNLAYKLEKNAAIAR